MKNKLMYINQEKINSIIIAIILMVPAITSFLNNMFKIDMSLSIMIISVMICALLVLSIMISKSMKYNVFSVIFSVLIIIIYAVSSVIRTDLNYSLLQLLFYVLIPIFVAQQKFSIKYVLLGVLIISVPLVLGIGKMLAIENVGLNQSDMYNSYCFIPPIIASFVYLLSYKNRGIANLFILLNFYYLIKVITSSPRGFLVVLVVFAFMIVFLRLKKCKSLKKYYCSLIITFICLILVILNANIIIKFLLDIFEGIFGDNVGFLVKTRRLLELGDITNGRNELWTESINNIIRSPLIGYGLESTKYLTFGEYFYPHNFVLQLLLDCGIVGLYPIIIVIKTLFFYFKKSLNDDHTNVILLYFIAISIPIASLSYDILKYSSFWLLIGFGASMVRRNFRNDSN